jgi:hypothetical protein
VRYFARIVHHVIVAEHAAWEEAHGVRPAGTALAAAVGADAGPGEGEGGGDGEPPGADAPPPPAAPAPLAASTSTGAAGAMGRYAPPDESLRLQEAVERLMAVKPITAPLLMRAAALSQLRMVKALPMPRRVPLHISKVSAR